MDWRDDADSLSEVVDKLYSLPGKLLYTDITFILSDGREVEAHKLILALSSPVFETEFYGGQWMEESCKRLVIEDDMGVFTEFLSLIYKQSFDLSVVSDFQLWDLLYLANKYLINKLIRILEETIMTRIKQCNDKADLVKHLERAKDMSIGEKFHGLIRKEIEVFAEQVMASQNFLNSRRDEAKEIARYENLHMTEGQIFKYAAEWCLNNCQTEQEAEKEFNAEFLNLISSENMTSEDFIQNVLPSSNIMAREAMKSLTKKSFENKSIGMVTRYVLNPRKNIFQRLYKSKIKKGVVNKFADAKMEKFKHFDIKQEILCTSLEQISLVCNITLIPKTEGEHTADIFLQIYYPDKRINQHTLTVSSLNPSKTITQNLKEMESDITFSLIIETKKIVELELMRQDLIIDIVGYRTGTSTVACSSLRLECSKTVSEATEIIRESLGIQHAKLFCCHGRKGNFFTGSTSKIGYLDFFLSNQHYNRKSKYFLAVSNKPFDNSNFDYKKDIYCMIYLQKEDSVVFVKHKIIRAEDRSEEPMCRIVKYAAGVVQEKDYEVVYGNIQQSDQEVKIHWMKENEANTGNLVFCIVCPKIQE